MKHKILMTLALLLTAVTGAWANWTGGTYTATTNEELGAIIVGADATLTINEGVTVTVSGGINAIGTLTVKGAGMLTVTGANGADGANSAEYDGGGGGSGSAGFTGTLIVDGATVNVTGGNGGNGGSGFQYGGNGGNGAAGVSGSITLNSGSVTVTGGAGGNGGSAMMKDGKRGSAGQAVTETITASTAEESDDNSTWTAISGNTSSKRYVRAESTAPAVEVTTNAASEGATFTEATFLMPTFDATAEYVIVRNMGSEDVTVLVGDGTVEQPRFRVRKKEQGEGYESVEYTSLDQIAALISVYDAVEEKTLTPQQDFYVKIFKIDEQTGQPLSADGVELADFDFAPGLYAVKAIAQDDSEDYGGETGFSNIFELYEGCDITFASTNALALKVGDTKYATVTVDEEDMTDNVEYDADLKGLLKEIEPGKTVTLTAAEGMKFMFGGTNDSDSQLTVHDGTVTNSYVPFYGFYADAYLKSEFVVPASELTDMSGAEISAMTFYTSSPAEAPWTSNVQVFVKEVSETSLSGYTGTSGATVVYEGTINGTEETMTIDFAQPYTYNGGNLLVGIYNTTLGNYKSVSWVGETVTGASVQGYNYSSLDAIEATQRDFIPKTTFSYKASTLILEDELSFQMPANDTLVSYTLVRDMKYKVSAEMSSDYITIVKDGNTYVPVDEEAFLPTVTNKYFDGQEFSMYLDTDYTLTLQKPGEEEGEWSNATIGVGTFRYAVIGKGIFADTIYTEPFRLVEGFEMEIPAGGYKTLFAVEAITTDAEGIELYTVASIEGDKALLSDAISTVPALTPMLVYNAGDEPMTVLLMPTEEEADDVTPAPQFLGTLEGLYMSGSNESVDFYACNGHDFVWVKETGYLAANRCFIQLRKGNDTARQLHIAFPGNATKITTTDFTDYTDGEFYDLNGRKLDKMPTRKGVYIMNGKKVVIK